VTEVNLFALVLENDPVFAKHLFHEPFTVAGDFIGEPMEMDYTLSGPSESLFGKISSRRNCVGV